MLPLVFASLIASALASPIVQGSCPSYSSNKPNQMFNHTHLGGLWYEYLYTPDHYIGAIPNECSTWNLLSHSRNPEGPYTFALLHNALNKTANTSQFTQLTYSCGAPGSSGAQACSYYPENKSPVMSKVNQFLGAKST